MTIISLLLLIFDKGKKIKKIKKKKLIKFYYILNIYKYNYYM